MRLEKLKPLERKSSHKKKCQQCGQLFESIKLENRVCTECVINSIEENHYKWVTITRDMALDAEDPSLEGSLWKWS